MPSGKGTLEFPNGMKYKGDWLRGKVGLRHNLFRMLLLQLCERKLNVDISPRFRTKLTNFLSFFFKNASAECRDLKPTFDLSLF